MENKKTVYILGAGFSMPAGLPNQAGLINKMLEIEKTENDNSFKNYIQNTLGLDLSKNYQIDLEDIYTPIDKTLINKTSLKNLTYNETFILRKDIDSLIARVISNEETPILNNDKYIETFSDHLIKITKPRIQDEKHDPVAVITTNWDTLLDKTIQNKLDKEFDKLPNSEKEKGFAGVIDYCCYVSSLDEGGKENKTIKPGLYAIAKGGFNIKLLKLHGSINWLQCPKCQRLFVKNYESKSEVTEKYHCKKYCQENYSESDNASNALYLNLIMPTFIKDFSNFQNKLIWHNAALELSEASKIVFIGYSLPQADFELRNLFFKTIRPNAKIEVVLAENDNPDNYCKKTKWITAGHRYETFFSGKDDLSIDYSGVTEYINKLEKQ